MKTTHLIVGLLGALIISNGALAGQSEQPYVQSSATSLTGVLNAGLASGINSNYIGVSISGVSGRIVVYGMGDPSGIFGYCYLNTSDPAYDMAMANLKTLIPHSVIRASYTTNGGICSELFVDNRSVYAK